ncbi:MAG: hypothetical protein BRD48_06125 [Bacteroidetes bacterium QS_9_68_14]|nr:MAG: hypothetical protein BRD48_06125 [Bacteroidetes bacterium QS_9_68_14]
MPIVNLTNVTVRLIPEDYDTSTDVDEAIYATFEPSGQQVEVQTRGERHEMDGVPVEVTYVTGFAGVPEAEDGTFYIVPQPVAKVSERPDLVTPDTGPSAVRDESGKVYACRRLFSVVKE